MLFYGTKPLQNKSQRQFAKLLSTGPLAGEPKCLEQNKEVSQERFCQPGEHLADVPTTKTAYQEKSIFNRRLFNIHLCDTGALRSENLQLRENCILRTVV